MSSLTAAFHVIQLGQLYRHTVRHLLSPVVEDQEPGVGDGDPFLLLKEHGEDRGFVLPVCNGRGLAVHQVHHNLLKSRC